MRHLPGRRVQRIALLAACMLAAMAAGPVWAGEGKYEIKPLPAGLAKQYDLDPNFYKKCTMVQGILIATSDKVSDWAHREAAYQFDMVMRTLNPEVASRMRSRGILCLLIGVHEFTSDLPQYHSKLKGKELDFYNWRNRGFLSSKNGRPVVVFCEEDVLEYQGGMQFESILIHEFGHCIQSAGFDKDLREQLDKAFRHAKDTGLYNDGRAAQRYRRIKSAEPISLYDALTQSFPDESPELIRKCLEGGDIRVDGKPTHAADVKVNKDNKVLIWFGGPKQCYAGKNRAEYWAEIVQDWFDTNRTMDHDHNHIHTRDQLKKYDPVGAALCEEVLGDTRWRYVSRATVRARATWRATTPPRPPSPRTPSTSSWPRTTTTTSIGSPTGNGCTTSTT